VFHVLEDLGIDEKDALLALNKTDRLPSESLLQRILARYPNAIPISAATRQGLDKFALAVSDALSKTFRDVDIETGVDNGKLMAYVAAHGEILSQRYNEARVVIHCRMPEKFLGRINEQGTEVRPHTAPAPALDSDSDRGRGRVSSDTTVPAVEDVA